MIKKYRIIALVFALILLLSQTCIFAADGQATPGTPPPGNGNPIGTLHGPMPMPMPMSIESTVVTQITSTYDGYIWRGWQVYGGPGGTVSLSRTVTVSNSYGATIAVIVSGISSGVGFNVTYSTSMTASYSHNVASGMYGWIGYDDWYHVKTYLCTSYFQPGHYHEDGSGWAQQWYMFGYFYGETSSYLTPPPNPN